MTRSRLGVFLSAQLPRWLGLATLCLVLAVTMASCRPRGPGEKLIKVRMDLSELARAADRFRADHGRYPNSLAELTSPSDGRPAYTDERRDPWTGEPYRTRIDPAGRMEFYSLGSDVKPGGDSHRQDISTGSPN